MANVIARLSMHAVAILILWKLANMFIGNTIELWLMALLYIVCPVIIEFNYRVANRMQEELQ